MRSIRSMPCGAHLVDARLEVDDAGAVDQRVEPARSACRPPRTWRRYPASLADVRPATAKASSRCRLTICVDHGRRAASRIRTRDDASSRNARISRTQAGNSCAYRPRPMSAQAAGDEGDRRRCCSSSCQSGEPTHPRRSDSSSTTLQPRHSIQSIRQRLPCPSPTPCHCWPDCLGVRRTTMPACRRRRRYRSSTSRSGSSRLSLTRTRKVTASLPSTMRWS